MEAGDGAEHVRALAVEPLHDGNADQVIEPDGSRRRSMDGEVHDESVIGDVPRRRGRVDVVAGEADEVGDHEDPGEPLRAPHLAVGDEPDAEQDRLPDEEHRRVGQAAEEVEDRARVPLQPLIGGQPMDPEPAQIEVVRLVHVDDGRADVVRVPAHRIVHQRVEQVGKSDQRQLAALVVPEREHEGDDGGQEMLRARTAEQMQRRQIRDGERGNPDGEEGMRVPQLIGAGPQEGGHPMRPPAGRRRQGRPRSFSGRGAKAPPAARTAPPSGRSPRRSPPSARSSGWPGCPRSPASHSRSWW